MQIIFKNFYNSPETVLLRTGQRLLFTYLHITSKVFANKIVFKMFWSLHIHVTCIVKARRFCMSVYKTVAFRPTLPRENDLYDGCLFPLDFNDQGCH